ncbi:hypothetical protein GQ53DRAFT_742188 [Thozetella sp. PMI_491]|nr:hypothetical protein GQ53DRAFT_742188 [Thozetella sp. PMI_491]
MAVGPPASTEQNTPPRDTADTSPIDLFLGQWKTCIEELERLEQRASELSVPVYNLGPLVKSQRSSVERMAKKLAQDTISEGLTAEQWREAALTRVMNLDTTTWRSTWPLVKKYEGLLHINKKFLRGPRHPVQPPLDWQSLIKQRPREEPVVFDAIVEHGYTWMKIIHSGHQALLKQINRARWEMGSDESDGEGDGSEDDSDEILGSTDFFHSVRRYIQGARWNHCRRLHFLLVNIRQGESKEIDKLLNMIRNMSDSNLEIEVRCSNDPFVTDPAPPLEEAIDRLLLRTQKAAMEEDYRLVTRGEANLDPSVLFSLVSDLLHGPVPLQPEGQRAVITKARELQQDGIERKGKGWEDTLVASLYPTLAGRRLVCTRAAAAYFWGVIGAIATDSEEQRGALALPRDGEPVRSSEELRAEFQRWSNVPLPGDVQLPIEIVDDVRLPDIDALVAVGQLPPMAASVARDVSPLNRSIYCYGWAHRMTTVSSHRGIPRQIELSIARHWGPEDAYGPDIWTKNLQGYLVHREKPTEWREMMPDGEIPAEVRRWTNDWDTWGRGISSYGLPDSKTWEGVGHPEVQRFGRGEKRKDPEGIEKVRKGGVVILPWDDEVC